MIIRIPGILIIYFLFCTCNAQAAWLLDTEKYHASVHGRLSCLDCHSEVSDSTHPNPGDVNKKLPDFFNAEKCTSCHGDVADEMSNGIHGGKRFENPEKMENCIGCHDPHRDLKKLSHFDPLKPIDAQCGACHERRDRLPEFSEDDKACLSCHQEIQANRVEFAKRLQNACFHCHGKDKNNSGSLGDIPIIDAETYDSTPHAAIACLSCHKGAAEFAHNDQKLEDCTHCHTPHDEKTIHDAHSRISCASCHLPGAMGNFNGNGNLAAPMNRLDRRKVHEMRISDKDALCGKCHFKGNTLGAASMALPAKSVICMPCHTATFSAGDNITIISLLIFIFGMVAVAWLILKGGHREKENRRKATRHLNPAVLKRIFAALVLDVLFQRRLYKKSIYRWLVHGLIFYPFVLRFSWGILALVLSLWLPGNAVTRDLLDKNHPATAFFFDITGVAVLFGIGLAIAQKFKKGNQPLPDLPKPDRVATGLLGAIIIIGFVLEAMRIAMTGFPAGSAYAFLGAGIGALFFKGVNGINDFYGWIWYGHALLTGGFIAYLPFSRMLHMLVAPVALIMQAVKSDGT